VRKIEEQAPHRDAEDGKERRGWRRRWIGEIILAALIVAGVVVIPRLYAQMRVWWLAPGLCDGGFDDRREAAYELARIGRPAVPTLIRRLRDDQGIVREAVAFALAQIGEEAAAAVPELTGRLHDEDWSVRETAAYALGRIGEAAAPAVPELRTLLNDEEEPVREAARVALDRIEAVGSARQAE
jgi:hypothetical protein